MTPGESAGGDPQWRSLFDPWRRLSFLAVHAKSFLIQRERVEQGVLGTLNWRANPLAIGSGLAVGVTSSLVACVDEVEADPLLFHLLRRSALCRCFDISPSLCWSSRRLPATARLYPQRRSSKLQAAEESFIVKA
ncbi:MAG: hypothetical protein H6526_08915 [Actinobacteria bacterium]|nr:hypothetical protein [Actinomycetota bacterium]